MAERPTSNSEIMMLDPMLLNTQHVTKAELLQQLETVKAQVDDPLVGLFGPTSMSWEINKYMTTYLGAGRAVLLQLAHPWVATAIDQHSRVKEDTSGRFRRTSIPVLIMLYGSIDQALQSAISVHEVHAKIKGKIQSDLGVFKKGNSYHANEINALRWVHSTLVETSMKMYELLVTPLNYEDKNRYYQESKIYGLLFGIPQDATPSNWNDFMDYNKAMWDSQVLTVGNEARTIANYLINLNTYSLLKKPWNHYQIMTSMMMPSGLREAFGLPKDNHENRIIFEKMIKRIKQMVRYLPRHLKYMPPYNEALSRIRGKKRPDYLTSLLNKLIYKQDRLVS